MLALVNLVFSLYYSFISGATQMQLFILSVQQEFYTNYNNVVCDIPKTRGVFAFYLTNPSQNRTTHICHYTSSALTFLNKDVLYHLLYLSFQCCGRTMRKQLDKNLSFHKLVAYMIALMTGELFSFSLHFCSKVKMSSLVKVQR